MPPAGRPALWPLLRPRSRPLCARWSSTDSSQIGFIDGDKFKPYSPALEGVEVRTTTQNGGNEPLYEVNMVEKDRDTDAIADTQAKPLTIRRPRTKDSGEFSFYFPEGSTGDAPNTWRKASAAPGDRLLHRHVLITGGSSGIGYATAKRFVEEGATSVAIMSRSRYRAAAAIDLLKRETGLQDAPVWAVICDVTQSKALNDWLRSDVKGRFKVWNTLVNCAGVSQSRYLLTMSEEMISAVLRTNLEAVISRSRHFHTSWVQNNSESMRRNAEEPSGPVSAPASSISSCIVNVSSLLALKGGIGASVYAASKAGLVAFSRVQALEAANTRKGRTWPTLRVNAVLPGYIDTPMLSGIFGTSSEARRTLEDQIPLGRFGTPAEVADAVVFLVANEYANNCMLNLDGGLSGC